MTEAGWLKATDVFRMLKHLGPQADVRRLRLFSCACCRHVWERLSDSRGCKAVERMEAEADRDGSDFLQRPADAYQGAVQTARYAARSAGRNSLLATSHALRVVLLAAEGVTLVPANSPLSRPVSAVHTALEQADRQIHGTRRLSTPRPTALRALRTLLRDIFGNPFRPVAFSPEWRTSTATAIAQQMYNSRDFDAMPILADALQDAGCENADILDHCRGPGPHVRGCWVVDLVLGRE